jgi:hypothetical protein
MPLQQFNVRTLLIPYQSQVGAQLVLYRALGKVIGKNPTRIVIINALALAAVVAAFTLFAERILGTRGAFAASAWMTLSPWLIMFATSAYWMAWLWFLPVLVTMALGEKMLSQVRILGGARAALTALFFLKFLCGYEYATTVVIAACSPLAYFGLRDRVSRSRLALAGGAVGVAAITAFALAVWLHAMQLSSDGKDGFTEIGRTAAKRLYSADPEALVATVCLTPRVGQSEADCKTSFYRSLTAPIPVVLELYATFRRCVPWIAGPDIIDTPDLEGLRRVMRGGEVNQAVSVVRELGFSGFLHIANLILTMLICCSLIGWAVLNLYRDRARSLPYIGLIVVAALAPLSWYVIAKELSYAYPQLNFVLWNLPFLPFLVGYLFVSSPPRRAAREAAPASASARQTYPA